jgi:hypothetical protein
MARPVLVGLFWSSALFLIAYSFSRGGAALWIPGATGVALIAFLADLYLHRNLVALDKSLLQTAFHFLSATVLASATLYWGYQLLQTAR